MRTFESAAPVLSAWMARKELTAAELSRRTGIDAGILRKIMTGRARAVSTRNLMALAHFFGCSMQELIDAIGTRFMIDSGWIIPMQELIDAFSGKTE